MYAARNALRSVARPALRGAAPAVGKAFLSTAAKAAAPAVARAATATPAPVKVQSMSEPPPLFPPRLRLIASPSHAWH